MNEQLHTYPLNSDTSPEKVFKAIRQLSSSPDNSDLVNKLVDTLKVYAVNLELNQENHAGRYPDEEDAFANRVYILDEFNRLLMVYQKTKNDDNLAQFIDDCTKENFPECHLKQRLQKIKNDGLLQLKQRNSIIADIKKMQITDATNPLSIETKKMMKNYVEEHFSKLSDEHKVIDDRMSRLEKLNAALKKADHAQDETDLEDEIRFNVNDDKTVYGSLCWSRLRIGCKDLNTKIADSELIPKRSRNIEELLKINAEFIKSNAELAQKNSEFTQQNQKLVDAVNGLYGENQKLISQVNSLKEENKNISTNSKTSR